MRLLRVIRGWLVGLLRFLLLLPAVLFGRLSWAPPRWLQWLVADLVAGTRWIAARPRLTIALGAGIVVLGGGSYWAYAWWQARPRPIVVQFSVSNPERTVIEDDKRPTPLVVTFDRPVAPLVNVGKDVTSGIRLSPPLAGTWRWASEKRLELTPRDDWAIGSGYTVTLAKSALLREVRLVEYHFTFETPPFLISVNNPHFFQDPTNPALKKAVIDLGFTHPVNTIELEKRVELRLAGQSAGILGVGKETTRFTVNYDKLKLNAYVHSDALPIPKNNTTLTLTVAKGVMAARGGKPSEQTIEQTIQVPGLYSLRIDDISGNVATRPNGDPDQVLVVQSSASVGEKEMQKGVTAWVLPIHNPRLRPMVTPEAHAEPYPWSDPSEVSDRILQSSQKLALDPIAAEREHSDTHSFRYQADVGRYLFVQIDKGLRSFGGYRLGDRDQRIVQVPPFPPELKILSRGALLATSGERKIAVLVRDLPGVRLEIGRVLPAQLQHLVSQSEGDFTDPQFYDLFGPDNLVERFERKVPLPRRPRGRAHYHAVDLSEYLTSEAGERRGVFLLTVREYDPERERKEKLRPRDREREPDRGAAGEDESLRDDRPQRQRREINDKRLVLVTDLGLLVKKAVDGSQDVFVQSIHSGAPVTGATVEVIAKNGVAVLTQTTDAAGHARFPRLEGLTRERAPLMFLVRKGGDTSFLPLNRRDRALDFSRFDVGGVQNARVPDQLSAYLFSDRGIYRPGDTIHIGVIVKSAGWARSVAGLPLEAEIYDPRGLVVRKEKLTLGPSGFGEMTHTTLDTSPTGVYPVNLYIVRDGRVDQQIGSTTVRVQEFMPDRMRVTTRLSREATEGWVSPAGLKARVGVQNLFGTPAEQRRVEALLTLSPAFPSFKGYPDYQFFDPQRAKEGYTDTLSPVTTSERGEAELDLRLERYAKATYRLHVLARAFEAESGRSVAAEAAALVSELPFLVGYKADGALDYVSRAATRTVAFIAIDPQAKATSVEGLTLDWIERTFVSMLTRQPNNTYKYESRKKEISLKQTPLTVPAAGMGLTLATDRPGNFAYVIRDREGLELNRVEYSVAGRGNVTRSLERNAELQLALDKKQYDAGEEIEISVRAPYTGAGLITIERDRVYAHQWFRSTTLASVQRIRVPRDFEGNGYVAVQFIRDPSSDEIFMSPLSYGVVPFTISLAQRTNAVSLVVPALMKAGQSLRMSLVVGRPARAVVFAVDEGILQVARYQPPDPLGFFFRKRALEVRSLQILDLILPEFKKLMSAAAPGGDAEGVLGRHLNPFKRKRELPVVFWSGLVDVMGQREFVYPLPEYFNGSLRVFAVTVAEGTIGVASVRTTVRGEFVLSPNAPTAVAPGDEFEVSVGVANNVAGSGADASVTLSLMSPPHLAVLGPATQAIKIGEGREGVGIFRLKVRDGAEARLGSATLRFTAAIGARSAALGTDVSVRPATPHATLVTTGSFTGSADVGVQRDLHSEYRHLEAAVSAVPLVLATGLANYLADFEHTCTEQLVSQAVSLVVLATRPELARTQTPASQAPRTLDDALRVLRTRQNAEGGFGLWTASVQADEFVSVYAAHLLLEARERGQAVPADMVQKSLAYLQQIGGTPARDLPSARRRAYAAYLLTRQGIVTTPMLTSLRETLEARHPKEWPQDLVASYLAASYQLLKQERLAAKLIDRPLARLGKPDPGDRYSEYYDPLVRDMQTLYLLARHFPESARRLPASTLATMAVPLNRGGFNTLSAANSILALDAYATAVGSTATGRLSITEIGGDRKARPLALPNTVIPRVPFTPGTTTLRFRDGAPLTTFYSVTESGFDRLPPDRELRSGLEVLREYIDRNGKPLASVKLGDEITVRLRVRAVDRQVVPTVALVDLLPGGFEVVLTPLGADTQPVFGTGVTRRLASGGTWNVSNADVREDRVLLYGVALSELSEYTYRIRATNAGRFVVPPAYAEALYEPMIRARSLPSRITVERPPK